VNKVFHEFGISRLYERASIYSWHKHAKARVSVVWSDSDAKYSRECQVVSLFDTLAHYPHLAKYVLRLGPAWSPYRPP
jgi:hypothetical protein